MSGRDDDSELTSEQAALLDLDERVRVLERAVKLLVNDVRKLMKAHNDRIGE
ncbi:hypothetical protein [Phenylobacterium sp.]|uniref:hypothetical protein n=1 Tax=Phenylobacterium sp. TaxID=1871053 RepID=UPI00301B8ED8